MLFVIILIVLSLLIYTLFNKSSKQGYIFICYFTGIALVILFSNFYFSRITEYNSIGILDYKIYSWVILFHISTEKLILMFEAGIALFMTAEILTVNLYGKMNPFVNILLFVICLFILWWMNPNTMLAVYLKWNTLGASALAKVRYINYAVIAVFIGYMVLTTAITAISFANSRIQTRKTGIFAMGLAVIVINLYMLTGFFIHALKLIVFSNINMFKFDSAYYTSYQRVNIVNFLFCTSIICILSFIFITSHKRYSFIEKI